MLEITRRASALPVVPIEAVFVRIRTGAASLRATTLLVLLLLLLLLLRAMRPHPLRLRTIAHRDRDSRVYLSGERHERFTGEHLLLQHLIQITSSCRPIAAG